jgi:hypothetical protein
VLTIERCFVHVRVLLLKLLKQQSGPGTSPLELPLRQLRLLLLRRVTVRRLTTRFGAAVEAVLERVVVHPSRAGCSPGACASLKTVSDSRARQ